MQMSFDSSEVFYLASIIHYSVRVLGMAILMWAFIEIRQHSHARIESFVVALAMVFYSIHALEWRPPSSGWVGFFWSISGRASVVAIVYYYILAKRRLRELEEEL